MKDSNNTQLRRNFMGARFTGLIITCVAILVLCVVFGLTFAQFIRNSNNPVNASTETDYIMTTNLFNTNGTINESAATSLLNAINYSSYNPQKIGYTAHNLENRTNDNSGKSIIFPMGYADGNSGEPIYWQATYLYNNYLTVWMTKCYSNSVWYGGQPTITYSIYANSLLQNFLNKTLYPQLTQKSLNLEAIFVTPQTAGYQTLSNVSSTDTSFSYAFSDGTEYKTSFDNMSSTVGTGSYLWLPSFSEVATNDKSFVFSPSTNTTSIYSGLWGLNSTDRSFDTTNFDGTETYNREEIGDPACWLRSGTNRGTSFVMLILIDGSGASHYSVMINGVRPAAHISLDALSQYVTRYTITAQPNNSSYGTVSGGGTYFEGASVTLRATANDGYRFVRWERNGSQVSTSANYTFTVSGSYTYTAIFEAMDYQVIYEVSGYPSLVGGLASGFENTGWGGTYSTTHVRSGDYALIITATASNPEVTISTTATVPIDTDTRNHVYYFQYWGYQEAENGGGTQIYWPIEEPSMGTLNLGPANQWNMYSFYGTRSGNALAGGQQVRIDFDNRNNAGTLWVDDFLMLDLTEIFGAGNEPSKEWCDQNIISGTNVQTIATNATTALDNRPGANAVGFDFAGWSTTPKTTSTTTQNVQYTNQQGVTNLTSAGGTITLYGVWQLHKFTVNASPNNANLGYVTGGGQYDYGSTVTLTAVSANILAEFLWWTDENNSVVSYEQNLTISNLSSDLTRIAVFRSNGAAVTSSGGGEARFNPVTVDGTDYIHVTAVAYAGYRFTGWTARTSNTTIDLSSYGDSANIPLSLVEGAIIVANFEAINQSNMNPDTGDYPEME